MATIESLVLALRESGRGVHALLWDDMGELVRALLVARAALGDLPMQPHLVSGEAKRYEQLNDLIRQRLGEEIEQEELKGDVDNSGHPPHPLWILFLQQAASRHVGSLLNGWRRPMSEPRGTLLVVRNADFDDFQRSAPDLASFIGPKIYDAGRMLMLCSNKTIAQLDKASTRQRSLPTPDELASWGPIPSSQG